MRLLHSVVLLVAAASPALAIPTVGAPVAEKKKATTPAPAPKPAPAPPAPARKNAHEALNPNRQFADPYGYNRSLWGSRRFVPVGVPMAGGDAPMTVGGTGAGGGGAQPMAPNVVVGEGAGDLSLSAPQLVNLLADPLYSDEGKTGTEVELLRGGMSSVPALVAGIGNTRPFSERRVAGEDGQPKRVVVTVSEECEALLYHIVTPSYRSPHEAGVKPQSPTMFVVKSWPAWLGKNRGKSLQQVHAEVRGVMDRYWQQGGVEQVLE